MSKIKVNVSFSGVAEVIVPDHLFLRDAKLLAKKVVLSRILAITNNNLDGPEGEALEEYMEECSERARKTADDDWMNTKTMVGGGWTIRGDTDV